MLSIPLPDLLTALATVAHPPPNRNVRGLDTFDPEVQMSCATSGDRANPSSTKASPKQPLPGTRVGSVSALYRPRPLPHTSQNTPELKERNANVGSNRLVVSIYTRGVIAIYHFLLFSRSYPTPQEKRKQRGFSSQCFVLFSFRAGGTATAKRAFKAPREPSAGRNTEAGKNNTQGAPREPSAGCNTKTGTGEVASAPRRGCHAVCPPIGQWQRPEILYGRQNKRLHPTRPPRPSSPLLKHKKAGGNVNSGGRGGGGLKWGYRHRQNQKQPRQNVH